MLLRLMLFPMFWAVVLVAVLVLYPVFAGFGQPVPPQVAGTLLPPGVAAGPGTTPVRFAPQRPAGPVDSIAYANRPGNADLRPPGGQPDLDAVEAEVLRLINEARRAAGVPPLAPDDGLALAAQAHSRDMLERDYFSHVTPEGLTPGDRVAGLDRRLVGTTGENIWARSGAGIGDPAQVARQAMYGDDGLGGLMNSPGHRQNILHQGFTHIGIGAAADADAVRLTQVFAGVHARLDRDLPLAVAQGDPLDLTPAPGSPEPDQYALFDPDQGRRIFGPEPLDAPVAAAAGGPYRLQLYYPQGNHSVIYFGPDLEVE